MCPLLLFFSQVLNLEGNDDLKELPEGLGQQMRVLLPRHLHRDEPPAS